MVVYFISPQVKHGSETKMNALFDKYRDIESADPENGGGGGDMACTAGNNNSKGEAGLDLILAPGTEALCKGRT